MNKIMKNILANAICILLSIVMMLCGVFMELVSFTCIIKSVNVLGIVFGIGLNLASIGMIVLSFIQLKDIIQGHDGFALKS